jgi:O-antigen/teichoic acid export membrane protein
MGEEFYGVWSILYSVMIFSGIGALGIGSIVNKFAAEVPAESAEKHTSDILVNAAVIILPMGIFTASVLWAAGGLIANNLDVSASQKNEFILAMRICAIGIIPQFLAKIPHGFFLSQYKNNLVRSLDFVANIFPWIGAILLSLHGQNLCMIAIWFVVVQMVIMLIYMLIVRKSLSGKLQPNGKNIRRMLGFSGFMFIESTAISMFQNLDKVIVGFILGPAAAGVYSVGTSVSLRMSMIAGQVTDVMVPYASQKNSLGDNEKLFSVFKRLSRYISLLTAVVGGLLIVWMHEILTIWISPNYAANYTTIFSILIVAYGILSLSRPAHQTLQGIGQVKFSSLLYMSASILMLACVYLFSLNFALPGAAAANAAMVLLLAMNLQVYKLMNGCIDWKDLLLSLLPGCLVPAATLLLVVFFPFLSTKVCLTGLIATCSVVVTLRDTFLREQIGKITGKGNQPVED